MKKIYVRPEVETMLFESSFPLAYSHTKTEDLTGGGGNGPSFGNGEGEAGGKDGNGFFWFDLGSLWGKEEEHNK